MRYLTIAVLLTLLAACSDAPPPAISPTLGPDDPAAPSAKLPYRPVMAGTAYRSIGSKP